MRPSGNARARARPPPGAPFGSLVSWRSWPLGCVVLTTPIYSARGACQGHCGQLGSGPSMPAGPGPLSLSEVPVPRALRGLAAASLLSQSHWQISPRPGLAFTGRTGTPHRDAAAGAGTAFRWGRPASRWQTARRGPFTSRLPVLRAGT